MTIARTSSAKLKIWREEKTQTYSHPKNKHIMSKTTKANPKEFTRNITEFQTRNIQLQHRSITDKKIYEMCIQYYEVSQAGYCE